MRPLIITRIVMVRAWATFGAVPTLRTCVQARGEVAQDDVSLWGCLAKVRDVSTGKLADLRTLMSPNTDLGSSGCHGVCVDVQTDRCAGTRWQAGRSLTASRAQASP